MDRVIHNWSLFQDAFEAARVRWPQEGILQRFDFFQFDKEGRPTGIIALDLQELS